MANHTTGTREQWLAARLELLKLEKEHTRRGDELARRRRELPWVRIDKEYRFETDEGSASLTEHGLATRPAPRPPLHPLLCRSDGDPPGRRRHGPSRDDCRRGSHHRRTSCTGR